MLSSKKLEIKPKNIKKDVKVCEYTNEEVRIVISKYLRMNYNELHEIMMEKDILDNLPVFETIIASSMYRSYKNGDFTKFS